MKNLYRHMIKRDEVNGDGEASGGDGTPTKTPATPPAEPASAQTDETDGGEFDDYGYPITKTPDKPGKKAEESGKPGEKASEEDVEIKEPVAGYGAKPLEEVPDDAKPPEEKPPEEKNELGFELEVKDLPAEAAKKIKDFAKAHKLTKEAAEALVADKKAEIKFQNDVAIETKKEIDKAKAKVRAGWDKELRTDKDFGGDNFARNLTNVEKVLKDFFPNTKKVLTEKGSMLPPNVMKDIAKLAKYVYDTERLVHGGERKAGDIEEKADHDDALDFYTQGGGN